MADYEATHPNASKKPPSPYMLFKKEMTPSVKAEHPDWSRSQISEYLANEWKNLKDKKKYKDEHKRLMSEYEE